MKQIKTITAKVKNAEKFDKEVNEALVKGWTICNRQLLHNPPLFYAELVREDYLPKYATCRNCKDFAHRESIHSYCQNGCRDLSKWRPKP